MRCIYGFVAVSLLAWGITALSVTTDEDHIGAVANDDGVLETVVEEKRDWKKQQKKIKALRQKQEEFERKQEQKRQKEEEKRRKKEQEKRQKEQEKRRKEQEKQRKEQEKQRKDAEKRRKEEEEKQRKEREKQEKIREKQEKERKKKIEEDRKKQEKAKRKEEEKKRKEEEKRRKEQWNNIYRDLKNKHGDSEDFWKMVEDKKEEHYPDEMKEKIKKGEKLKAEEEDKFENEYGRYKSRSETTLIDVLAAINAGNDVENLDEGDMKKNAPTFNYQLVENAEEIFCSKATNKNKQLCKKKGKKGKKSKKGKKGKRSLDEEFGVEEAWERKKRDAKRDRVYLWMDRTVPYEIDPALGDSVDTIRGALDEIQQKSCISFVEHKDQTNWIKFVKKSGCWSSVGRMFWNEGFQEISLGPNCMYKGIIMHEVMHALGFYHEQSRPDRNQYVEIFWENIMNGQQHNFEKYGHDLTDVLGAPYDYSSIMHYGKYSFAMNAKTPTIQSIHNPAQELGQRNGLSPIDVQQLNTLYNCHDTGNGWSKWSSYAPCNSACQKRRTRFCMDTKDRTKCPNPVSTALLAYGLDSETKACTVEECNAPVDGHWNKWGDWGACSVTCGEGSHSRKRKCTDPAPKNGGKACVGLPVERRECLQRSCSEGPYDCTFDVDVQPLCSWQSDSTVDFQWIRNSGGTPSSSTGPDNDHTSGAGYYMFIESSSPARPDYKARLVSPVIQAGARCMNIAYSMYGQSTGSVNVHVMDTVTEQLKTVFTKTGDQLKLWHVAEFDINGNNPYKVIIEAVRGGSFQGDSAIDDISIREGTCASIKEPKPTEAPAIPTVSSVGCYRSAGYINGKRPFPVTKNFRNEIVWSDYMNSLNETVLKCAAFARVKGYEYFGIEFYGECWTGPTAEINYGRDGEATDCFPEPKHELGPFLVGAEYTHFVYKWMNLPPVN